jgi:hypothetical protein
MTRAMTKVAPTWRKAAMTTAMMVGLAGSTPARAFAPAQPVAPAAPVQQPGYPPTPVQPAPEQRPPAQPGHPAAPSSAQPGAQPPASADYPPQYPAPPTPGYPQGTTSPPSVPPAGYPQQYPPQQGYPQSYPQQYPPQQGYPPQYPPQEGYPPEYPPSSYPQQPYGQPGYPPPGYHPPAGYPVPPPPPPAATRPHGHGALLLMPYLGVQANEGATGQDQNAGFRMGGLIGYRANGQFSFNGELTIDVLNLKDAPPGVDLTGAGVDLAFSPLFHFDAGALELAVGPKIGVGVTVLQSQDDLGTIENSTTGFLYGVNLGAFLPLGNGASLGALVGFEVRTVSQVCSKYHSGSETCVDTSNANSDKILGVTGAALF